MTELWIEQYRPNTVEEYVFKSASQKERVLEWIDKGIPHCLFEGKPGTGKTSLAYLILKARDVNPGDILFINASRERKPEDLQDKIINFASTWPLGDFKYVVLDECDSMTPLMQRILRGEMEKYHDICRFIMTCNYANKIIPAIHSRVQTLHFESLDIGDFSVRVGEILVQEGIQFEMETLEFFIERSYPDLRKCIGLVQQYSLGGVLKVPDENIATDKDYLLEMADLFKKGRITDARKLLVSQVAPEEYEDIYRFFYENLEIFSTTEEGQNEAILVIAKGLRNHTLCADQEINLAATLIELSNVGK